MNQNIELINKIRNTIVIRVAAKGEGLSLTIPKEVTETYQVLSGDVIRVTLSEHYRRKTD